MQAEPVQEGLRRMDGWTCTDRCSQREMYFKEGIHAPFTQQGRDEMISLELEAMRALNGFMMHWQRIGWLLNVAFLDYKMAAYYPSNP